MGGHRFLFLSGLLVNPAEQLVLRDDQALADDKRGEALAVHQLVCPCPGKTQDGCNLFGVQSQGKLA